MDFIRKEYKDKYFSRTNKHLKQEPIYWQKKPGKIHSSYLVEKRLADDKLIYTAKDLRVGLFTDTSGF